MLKTIEHAWLNNGGHRIAPWRRVASLAARSFPGGQRVPLITGSSLAASGPAVSRQAQSTRRVSAAWSVLGTGVPKALHLANSFRDLPLPAVAAPGLAGQARQNVTGCTDLS